MLGRQKREFGETSFLLDLVAFPLVLLFVVGVLGRFGPVIEETVEAVTGISPHLNTVGHLRSLAGVFPLMIFLFLAALRFSGFYRMDPGASLASVVWGSLRGVFLGVAVTGLAFFLLQLFDVNRSVLLGFGSVLVPFHFAKEWTLRRIWRERVAKGRRLEALLICRASEREARLHEVAGRGASGVQVREIRVADAEATIETCEEWGEEAGGPVSRPLGNVDMLGRELAGGRFDVLILGDLRDDEATQKVFAAAEEQGIEVWIFTGLPDTRLAQPEVDEYEGRPVIVFRTTARYEARLRIKRLFDFGVSLLLVLLLLPVFFLLIVAIRVTSAGPALFVQARTGWRGRPFRLYKFRTMYTDAEARLAALQNRNEMSGPVFKMQDDPRITPLGRFLRKFSLDELPQLFNVLKGEMSLVGPRPLPVYETERFEALRDHRRYSVLPGITGLWQISGRSDIEDFSEWVKLDLEYIDRWSLLLDIMILLRTAPVVLRGTGAR